MNYSNIPVDIVIIETPVLLFDVFLKKKILFGILI